MKRCRVLCSVVLLSLGLLALGCARNKAFSSLQVTPSTASLASPGLQVQFTATAFYQQGEQSGFSSNVTNKVTWTSSNPAVATVDNSGVATAVNVGTTTITATMQVSGGPASTSSELDVTSGPRALSSLTIVPGTQTVYAQGQTAQFLAIGTFNAAPMTQDLTTQVTWLANIADVATINSTGLATSLPCTSPASGCMTPITATYKNPDGTLATATSSLTTSPATNFPPLLPSLTVYKVGQGSGTVVSTSEPGINCGTGASCTANFSLNTNITLSETAAPGSTFVEWSSNCNGGTNLDLPTCTVPMVNNQTVGAIFALNPTP
jgi:Bacterial Ig-like domain (group 2)/Divergent InlB B-repeat domain